MVYIRLVSARLERSLVFQHKTSSSFFVCCFFFWSAFHVACVYQHVYIYPFEVSMYIWCAANKPKYTPEPQPMRRLLPSAHGFLLIFFLHLLKSIERRRYCRFLTNNCVHFGTKRISTHYFYDVKKRLFSTKTNLAGNEQFSVKKKHFQMRIQEFAYFWCRRERILIKSKSTW